MRTAVWMCAAGGLTLLIGAWAARGDVARAQGLGKLVALTPAWFAAPLAVFGTLHLAAVDLVLPLVPSYMPWHAFWGYFVGASLLAASLSIATRLQVRWSGLLFGIMMALFVAMIHVPGSLEKPGDRFGWTIVLRELSFAGGGWVLAAQATDGRGRAWLGTVGRVLVGSAAVFFGVEHFLHPDGCPGVPLRKLTPGWIPARLVVGTLTGAVLVVCGTALLLGKRTRLAATVLGTWLLALVVLIYGPILATALADPGRGAQIEGVNYFFDTLLFAGTVLTLAYRAARDD